MVGTQEHGGIIVFAKGKIHLCVVIVEPVNTSLESVCVCVYIYTHTHFLDSYLRAPQSQHINMPVPVAAQSKV